MGQQFARRTRYGADHTFTTSISFRSVTCRTPNGGWRTVTSKHVGKERHP